MLVHNFIDQNPCQLRREAPSLEQPLAKLSVAAESGEETEKFLT
jgi:hypothetical protein